MAGNGGQRGNIHMFANMMHSTNASSSTISTRSTLSHASNQSNTTNTTNPNNNNNSNMRNFHNTLTETNASVFNNTNNNTAHNNNNNNNANTNNNTNNNNNFHNYSMNNHNLNNNGGNNNNNNTNNNTNNNNNNNIAGATGLPHSSNMSNLLGGNNGLMQQFNPNAALANFNNNNNNNNNSNGGNNNGMMNGSQGGGSAQPGNFGNLGNGPNMFQNPQAVAVGDIPMGSGGNAMQAGTSEIQKFAEQSRNHGKMIEFFIENHLPPLMKTDKLIKELGKMDFDTFQANYQNNANLSSSHYGFEFDHLTNNNSSNNNSLPSLEKDQTQQLQDCKNQLMAARGEIAKLKQTNAQLVNDLNQSRIQLQEMNSLRVENENLKKQMLRQQQIQQSQQQQQHRVRQQLQQQQQQQQQHQQQRADTVMSTISNHSNASVHNNNNNNNNNDNINASMNMNASVASNTSGVGSVSGNNVNNNGNISNININNNGLARHDLVKYVKNDPSDGEAQRETLKCTEQVDQLRKEIQNRKNIDESNWNIEADKEFNPYLDPILNYLMHNEENKIHPDLTLGGGKKDGNGDSGEEDETTIPQTSLIERYTIQNNGRVPSLNGQYGVRAKQLLPLNTVLGQYCGVEYLLNEYKNVFGHTNEFTQKMRYAYNLDIAMPKKDGNNNNNNGNPNNNESGETYNVIIDALFKTEINNPNCEFERSLLTFVNDCRKDINNKVKELSEDDRIYENVKFVKVYVNAWPMIFVVTCKDIDAGSELLAFYGKDYDLTINNEMLSLNNNNMINSNNNSVISSGVVVNMVGSSNNSNVSGSVGARQFNSPVPMGNVNMQGAGNINTNNNNNRNNNNNNQMDTTMS